MYDTVVSKLSDSNGLTQINDESWLSDHSGRTMQPPSPPFAAFQARPVPRYTSYPTAPQFSPDVGPDEVAGWLADLVPAVPVSLYLHVPYCVQLCWYCGCHTRVANRPERLSQYRDALVAEIATVRRQIGFRARAAHVHWGGGTPTVFPAADFAQVSEALAEAFEIGPDTELAVEIDPRTVTDDMIAGLAAVGVSRVSFGVQDFDARVQAAINRIQPFEMTRAAVTRLRAAGMRSINLDLIYGLPRQTVDSLRETIRLALALAPDRLALFGYAHVPWMKPHQKKIAEADLPGTEMRWTQAEAAREMLVEAGYVAVGIDHFARLGDGLARAVENGTLHRNFQGYTTDDAGTLIGLGASAISSFRAGYAQNAVDIRDWRESVVAGRLATARGVRLSLDDRLRRDAIERVMCDLSVDLGEVATRQGADVAAFAESRHALDDLARAGLVDVAGTVVRVRPEARPLARVVAAAFDAYLAAGRGRHSAAV